MKLLDTVAFQNELPEQGLRRGDLGAMLTSMRPMDMKSNSSPALEERKLW